VSRWYLPDGTVLENPAPGAVPSVTTILGATWPKPGLRQWRENQLLSVAWRTVPREEPRIDERTWARAVLSAVDAIPRVAANEGRRLHERLAAGDVPSGLRAELLRCGIDLDEGEPERTIVGDSYAGTIDLLGPHWLLDWKTTGGDELRPRWEWAAQLAAYDRLAGHRRQWVVVILHRDSGAWRIWQLTPEEMGIGHRAWSAAWQMWRVLEELGEV
jgi:hypothetical protein